MTRDDNKHMSATFATKSAQICACFMDDLPNLVYIVCCFMCEYVEQGGIFI